MCTDTQILDLIIEADTWSQINLDKRKLDSSLRSELLKPNTELWDYVTPDAYIKKAVIDLCQKRSDLIDKTTLDLGKKPQGRILCFYPELSLKDAMVFMASSGFIDQKDSPPWDTWLFYREKDIKAGREYASLYSWVPDKIVGMVDQAIQEDLYDCLIWAESLEQRISLAVTEQYVVV